ncbi:hypothetical protein ANN_07982 [Periplaneta americana]|uniref:Uncharacterized protein n=1 Tax=Periplaneta americana TaxID=6978 RepID=A0ABQ8T049_PERAM|nr:hypothetical protein ANN_07982 [Periplaneta americana]
MPKGIVVLRETKKLTNLQDKVQLQNVLDQSRLSEYLGALSERRLKSGPRLNTTKPGSRYQVVYRWNFRGSPEPRGQVHPGESSSMYHLIVSQITTISDPTKTTS